MKMKLEEADFCKDGGWEKAPDGSKRKLLCMTFDVEGLKRLAAWTIKRRVNFDASFTPEQFDECMVEYAKLWAMKMAGIDTYPIKRTPKKSKSKGKKKVRK